MPKTLAQVIAVERGMRQKVNDAGKTARKNLSEARVTGQVKTYKPDVEDENTLPPSERSATAHQKVQSTVLEELATVRAYAEAAMDVVATKDATNMAAKADIVVEGVTLQAGVGISHLLWMEKDLNEWRGFLAALPVHSSVKQWSKHSSIDGVWVQADPDVVPRTKKETVPLVLHPPTDKHPAQVTTVQQDTRTGQVSTTAHTGAIPEKHRRELLDRCDKVIRAVRDAIARANQTVATEVTGEGAAIMGYILG